MLCNSKFFGKPNGTKIPPKQSKLSFATKTTAVEENEEVDMVDADSDDQVKPKVKRNEVEHKENIKLDKGLSTSLGGFVVVDWII